MRNTVACGVMMTADVAVVTDCSAVWRAVAIDLCGVEESDFASVTDYESSCFDPPTGCDRHIATELDLYTSTYISIQLFSHHQLVNFGCCASLR